MSRILLPLLLLVSAITYALPGWNFRAGGNGGQWTLPTSGEIHQLADGLYVQGKSATGLTIELDPPLDAAQAARIEYRFAAAEYSSAYLYFAGKDEDFADNRRIRLPLRGLEQSPVKIVDCRANNLWKGQITRLKLTPIGRELDNTIVHFLRFLHADDNLIANGSFENLAFDASAQPDKWQISNPALAFISAKGIGDSNCLLLRGSVSASQNFELPDELPFHLSLRHRLEKDGILKLVFFDIFDQEISRQEMTIPATVGQDWSELASDIAIPPCTAFVTLTLQNQAGNAFFDDVKATPIPREADQYRSWEANWLWAQDSKDSKGKPVHFRFAFQEETPATVQEKVLQVVTRNIGGSAPCDAVKVLLNGQEIQPAYSLHAWERNFLYDLKPFLLAGRNVLAVEVNNIKDPGGLLAEITTTLSKDGKVEFLRQGTNPNTWKASGADIADWADPAYDDSSWGIPLLRGQPSPGSFCRIPYRFLGKVGSLSLLNLSLPKEINAARPQRFTADVEVSVLPGQETIASDTALHFHFYDSQSRTTTKLAPVKLTPEQLQSGKFRLDIPLTCDFLRAGDLQLRIFADRLALVEPPEGFAFNRTGNFWETTVKVTSQRHPELADCQIVDLDKVPKFKINGKLYPVNRFVTATHTQLVTEEHLQIAEKMAFPEQHILDFHTGGNWTRRADGTCDFTAIDTFITSYLSRHPDTYLTLHWVLDTSGAKGPHREWILAHPSEWAMDSKGNTNVGTFLDVNTVCTMASEPWQDVLADSTVQFVRHISESPYADHIIGLMPSCGLSTEWLYWGSQAKTFMDYSEPYQNAFRKWLQEKYTSIDKLNAAWQKQFSDWKEAGVPSEEERKDVKYFDHLLPEKHQALIDLGEFHSHLVAKVIRKFCSAVKKTSNNRMLAGVYYGYITYVTGPYQAPFSGHHDIRQLLDKPEIDFLMSPNRYDDRGEGGAAGFMTTAATLRKHGILWVNEADNRLLHAWDRNGKVYGLRDSRAVLEREFASCFATGTALAWLDFGEGWLPNDSRLVQAFRKCLAVGRQLATDNASVHDEANAIAVVADEKGITRTSYNQHLFLNLVGIYPHLLRTGVQVKWYLLDDLDRLGNHKCIIFTPTCTKFTPEQEQVIKEKLANSNRTLVFLYSTGTYDDSGFQPKQAGKLAGLEVDYVEGRAKSVLRRVQGDDELLQGLPDYYSFGFAEPTDLLMFPQAKGDGVKALFTINESGTPGFVRRRFDDWTAIYTSAPGLPTPVLRNLARANGLHIYNEAVGDTSYAAKDFLAIHTIVGGRRALNAPEGTVSATNLVTGETYPVRQGKISLDIPLSSTTILKFNR